MSARAAAAADAALSHLAQFPLLAGLAPALLRELDEWLEWLDVAGGVTLFREGDPAEALLLVLEGRVVLSSHCGLTGACSAGTALGPLSLVADGPRQATARAESRCRILRLRRDAYHGLRSAAPEAACALLERIVRESAALAREALGHLVDTPPPRSEAPAHSVDSSPPSP